MCDPGRYQPPRYFESYLMPGYEGHMPDSHEYWGKVYREGVACTFECPHPQRHGLCQSHFHQGLNNDQQNIRGISLTGRCGGPYEPSSTDVNDPCLLAAGRRSLAPPPPCNLGPPCTCAPKFCETCDDKRNNVVYNCDTGLPKTYMGHIPGQQFTVGCTFGLGSRCARQALVDHCYDVPDVCPTHRK